MENYNDFIKDLSTLISFKSVQGEKTETAPFGTEVKSALSFFLSLAEKFGFKTVNYDNFVGEVTFGEGEEIGIIGHLDVVPEGTGWKTPPYTLTEKDGVLYGRGVGDDKAPMLLILYILKELKDKNIPCNKKFRLFIGCNEETGWKDVEYLNKVTTVPVYGFSPDGNFPVSYAEKGMCVIEFTLDKFKNFNNVSGGTVINAVCGEATAKGIIDHKALKECDLSVKDGFIKSIGKSCHGSRPELGINAMEKLFRYMIKCGENLQNEYDYLFGKKFGFFNLVNEQGDVTFSPDLISEEKDCVKIKCDMRIPAPFTEKDVISLLDKSGLKYSLSVKHPPLMVEKESELVTALIGAYNAVTGENATPISQSGSTFARVFEMGVAFGPEFPNKPSTIHEPNECISVSDMLKTYEIYKKAIFTLAK